MCVKQCIPLSRRNDTIILYILVGEMEPIQNYIPLLPGIQTIRDKTICDKTIRDRTIRDKHIGNMLRSIFPILGTEMGSNL